MKGSYKKVVCKVLLFTEADIVRTSEVAEPEKPLVDENVNMGGWT